MARERECAFNFTSKQYRERLRENAQREVALYQVQAAMNFLTNANVVLHNQKIREALNILVEAENFERTT